MEGDGHTLNSTRKKVERIFKNNELDVDDVEIAKRVDYLDISLDLNMESYKPFRKENSKPKYVNVGSNHPKSIIKQLPVMINSRLSMLSSNTEAFEANKSIYQDALKHAGYNYDLKFTEEGNNNNEIRRRKNN